MNKLTSLLSIRYLLGSTYERSISMVTLICFVSIAIGAGSLALVSAVMRGFQIEIHKKLQGIHADALIQSYGTPLNDYAINQFIQKEFPGVKATSPLHIGHAIIKSQEDDTPTVVLINGIDPARERLVSALEQKLITSSSLLETIQNKKILIGKTMATQNHLSVGMPLTLYYMDELHGKNKVSVHTAETVIGGIFETGIDEYDANMIFTSPQFFQHMFPNEGITQIKLAFNSGINQESTIDQLQQKLQLDVFSWKDLYPSLVSALELERYAMFFILLLITIVASMNIIALLFMMIQAKRSDIAILYSMGSSTAQIRSIFIIITLLITSSAAAAGLVLAIGVCWFLNAYPLIKLPDAYYVSYLPAHLEWHMVIFIFVTVVLIAILATIIPLLRIRSENTAEVLRFEG